MSESKLSILICKLNPKKVSWHSYVTNAKMLLQVDFDNKDASFITPNHKNVVNVGYMNNKANLYLLLEHNGIHSVGGEAKSG